MLISDNERKRIVRTLIGCPLPTEYYKKTEEQFCNLCRQVQETCDEHEITSPVDMTFTPKEPILLWVHRYDYGGEDSEKYFPTHAWHWRHYLPNEVIQLRGIEGQHDALVRAVPLPTGAVFETKPWSAHIQKKPDPDAMTIVDAEVLDYCPPDTARKEFPKDGVGMKPLEKREGSPPEGLDDSSVVKPQWPFDLQRKVLNRLREE